MSADLAVRAAVIAALRGHGALAALINRVHDGEPVKATPPIVVVGECAASDWGTKDREGRELRLALSVRDTGETSTRVGQIVPLIDAAVRAIGPVVSGGVAGNWQIGSITLIRSRLLRSGEAQWSAVIDYRLRALRV